MAITLNGVIVALPTKYVPSGYVPIDVDKVANTNLISHKHTVTVPKLSVENANELLTFQGIVDAVDTAVLLYLTTFFVALNTVNAYASFNSLETNADSPEKSGYYTTENANYTAHVQIFIETI
tara:strand:+ start:447 stop:815 length:369 start_codon:yes stop_codon:yes gene_type:complete